MGMAVANAVRPDRPSTRSTRTTRGTARDNKIELLNDRRVRSSTRSGKEADRAIVQEPRRKASTRNRTMVDSERPSTRKRASTRAGGGVVQAKTDYKRVKRPSGSRPSRTKALEERLEVRRYEAPIQFFAVMFLVIVVSVFAFGLLRGDPIAQQPKKPAIGDNNVEIIYEKGGTTSTNTGILRGQ